MGINALIGFQTHLSPTLYPPKNIANIRSPDQTVMYAEAPNSSSFGTKYYRKADTFRVNDNRIGNFNSQAGGGRRSLHLLNYPEGIHTLPLYSNYGFIDGSAQYLSILDLGGATGRNLLEDGNEKGTYFDINK